MVDQRANEVCHRTVANGRRLADQERVERSDRRADFIRRENQFNFIKMHYLTQMASDVRRFGSISMYSHQQKKRLHPDAPRTPCASGGPSAVNVNSRSGCSVFYWVVVGRPNAPDATKDSEGTRRREVLQTQKGSPDTTR